jgi:hypothetical protein
MRKAVVAALIAIPSLVGAAIVENVISIPFDWLKQTETPTIGAELHFKVPENYPAIKGFVMTRTTTGTNVELQ